MLEWLRKLNEVWKPICGACAAAAAVWTFAWPIAWTGFIAPAIAAEAQAALADDIAELQASIDKIASGQAGVGSDSREAQRRDKYLEDLLRFSLCIQVNPDNTAACGSQPDPPAQ